MRGSEKCFNVQLPSPEREPSGHQNTRTVSPPANLCGFVLQSLGKDQGKAITNYSHVSRLVPYSRI